MADERIDSTEASDVSFELAPSLAARPRKAALLIGCSYKRNKDFDQLLHAHNDVIEMRKLLIEVYHYKEDDITVLMDDGKHKEPTRENIIIAMKNLVANAIAGDKFIFHYAGHGEQTVSEPGNETEADGMDEAIVPCDATYGKETLIIDNEMNRLLVCKIPLNAQLIAFFDMSHSVTALDLNHYYCNEDDFIHALKRTSDGEVENETCTFSESPKLLSPSSPTTGAFDLSSLMPSSWKTAQPSDAEVTTRHKCGCRASSKWQERAQVISIEAAYDEQFPWELYKHGSDRVDSCTPKTLTAALVRILRKEPHPTFANLLRSIQTFLNEAPNDMRKDGQRQQEVKGRPTVRRSRLGSESVPTSISASATASRQNSHQAGNDVGQDIVWQIDESIRRDGGVPVLQVMLGSLLPLDMNSRIDLKEVGPQLPCCRKRVVEDRQRRLLPYKEVEETEPEWEQKRGEISQPHFEEEEYGEADEPWQLRSDVAKEGEGKQEEGTRDTERQCKEDELEGETSPLSPDFGAESYIPEFVWNSWLESRPFDTDSFSSSPELPHGTLNIADIRTPELFEQISDRPIAKNIFYLVERLFPNGAECSVFKEANAAFEVLERDAETAVRSLLQQVYLMSQLHPSLDHIRNNSSSKLHDYEPELALSRHTLQALQKYLLFLQFRNSDAFLSLLNNTNSGTLASDNTSSLSAIFGGPSTTRPEGHEHNPIPNWNHLLSGFTCFFSSDYEKHKASGSICNCIFPHYNEMLRMEVSVGVSLGSDEFVSSPLFCARLEDKIGDQSKEYLFSFPISPRCIIKLHINVPTNICGDVHEQGLHPLASNALVQSTIRCCDDTPSVIRVYNTIVLQTSSRFIIYKSPRSMRRTLTFCNGGNRFLGGPAYDRLIRKCSAQSPSYILLEEDSIEVADLTDFVTTVGRGPLSSGGFADVWEGIWRDQTEAGTVTKRVAVKALRAQLVGYVQKKVLALLKKEVKAWHLLCHPHVASLHGIMQIRDTLAMVSPWCGNGNIVKYLRDTNPGANRYKLLYQIASGIAYLHDHMPKVVHGDLKGQNILIDAEGKAVITDFGLSKVKEDLSIVLKSTSSTIGGSVRWMAPELFLSQVESGDGKTSISTSSDVYAFASVCWEVLTDQPPYPNLPNDIAVTVAVMSGRKPSSGSNFVNTDPQAEELWRLMDECWDQNPDARPTMARMCEYLDRIRS